MAVMELYAVEFSRVILMITNNYIRIPFKEHGRDRKGADCWGLAFILFKEELNIDLPIMDTGYENTKDKMRISELIQSHRVAWDAINIGEEKAFDIAVFRMRGQPMHIGIVVKPGLMIHCERGSGVYLTYYNREGQWDKRLEGFYRYADAAGSTGIASSVSSS